MSKGYCAVRIPEEKNFNIAVLFALIFSVMMHAVLLQALSGTVDLPAAHFEPQVAMYCGPDKQQVYHSQYMTESGHWVTDLNNKAKCLKDKVEILDYCKKVSTVVISGAIKLCRLKSQRKLSQTQGQSL